MIVNDPPKESPTAASGNLNPNPGRRRLAIARPLRAIE